MLAAKAPSREGPRVAARETAAVFRVAEAFVVRGITCDDMQRPRASGAVCAANGYLSVELSNQIDASTYHAKQIQIEGEEFQDNSSSFESVGLSTPAFGGRAYTVVIRDGITDIYGQSLGGPKRLPFTTKRERYEPAVYARDGLFVLDPRFAIRRPHAASDVPPMSALSQGDAAT